MCTSLLSSRFASLEWYEPGLTAKSKEARPGECNICSHMFLCLIFRLVYMELSTLAGGRILRRRPTLLLISESVKLRSVATFSYLLLCTFGFFSS